MEVMDWIKEKVIVSAIKPWYDKLEGKKTYIILGVSIALGALETWNALCGETIQAKWCVDFIVPPYIYAVLAALGIYTRKAAKLK